MWSNWAVLSIAGRRIDMLSGKSPHKATRVATIAPLSASAAHALSTKFFGSGKGILGRTRAHSWHPVEINS